MILEQSSSCSALGSGFVLPSRIWVVGPCGSGKSTLAARLADKLGVAPVHLDDLFWKPGWVQSSLKELEERVAPVVAGDSWVMDGNYGQIRVKYQDRVQLYVWLDLPIAVTVSRVLWRGVRRSFTRQPVCNGNCETLRSLFASRSSIIWYGLKTHRTYREQYREEMPRMPHVRLRNQREVEAWLRRVRFAGISDRRTNWFNGPVP